LRGPVQLQAGVGERAGISHHIEVLIGAGAEAIASRTSMLCTTSRLLREAIAPTTAAISGGGKKISVPNFATSRSRSRIVGGGRGGISAASTEAKRQAA